ncbi:MAG: ABC transporter permease [Bryobacteraceae bacterium]
MGWIGEILRRCRMFLHRSQFEQDLAEEMRLHLDLRAAETDSAAARRRFGNETQLREASRGVWISAFVETAVRDLRYGLRTLLANPGFTATAVLSLALGIGANTAIFSILNAVMLRSLPVEDPHRLVTLRSDRNEYFTNPIWEQVRDHQTAFSGALAFGGDRFDLSAGGESHFAEGLWVSGDFFKVLGVPAMRGRVFTPADDLHGGGRSGPVAVISYAFWRRQFGADPNVLGKNVRLDRHAFAIVGVTPPWFTGLDVDRGYDVAIPIGCEPILHIDRSALDARSWWWIRMLGRLAPGTTLAQAEARMKALAPELNRATLPPNWDAEGKRQYLHRSFDLLPAGTGFSETGHEYRKALFTIMTVVALVLLIACANIANLLLARATARQREITVRMAIGAARSRVVRQLLTESLLLSVFGSLAGLLFAVWGSHGLVRLLSRTGRELELDVSPDLRVLGFTIGVAVLTGLLFGLAPALRATRISPNDVLKEHARGMVSGTSRFNLGNALIGGQVALCLVLLVGASLFLGTFRNLLSVDLGFKAQNVLLVNADAQQANIPKAQRSQVFQDIVARLRNLPGVLSASSSVLTPLSHMGWNNNLSPEGYTPKNKEDNMTWFNRVSPGYFRTMQTRLLLGRDFSERDSLAAPKVMIINETAAHRFFGAGSPLGKTISEDRSDVQPGKRVIYQVIGVTKDAKYDTIDEKPRPSVYLSSTQDDDPWTGVAFEVRSEQPVSRVAPAIRSVIGAVNPNISLEFRDFETQVNESLLQPRLVALLSGFFGGLALLLAMIGLYGVTAYGVARREGEIGIRMALGAQPGSVVWLVLRDVVIILMIGAVIGLAASLAAGHLVTSLLYGLKAYDFEPLFAAAVILGVGTGIAAYLPARRAARLDPMSALREE